MSFVIPSSAKMLMQKNNVEYEEMRRKLLETEQKLQNLNKLEEEVQSVVSTNSDRISSVSDYRAGIQSHRGAGDDDDEGTPSVISTVPDSYTHFVNHKITSSSTPSKLKYAPAVTKEAEMYDLDRSMSIRSDAASNKYERKLLYQNHRLLMEVERLVDELHVAQQEVAVSEKYQSLAKRVPDLEDKIEGLLAENTAQDKALRAAEKHIEEGVKRNCELQKKLDKFEGDMADMRRELDTAIATKREMECQKDEALQNLMEAQDSLEEYQRRMKNKIRKMEDVEDELRDNIASVTREREDLMEQFSDMQTSLTSQEAQINRLLNDLEMGELRKQDTERENKRFQEQLELLTAQLNEYESDTRSIRAAKNEKQHLEAELSKHRTLAQEIADLLMLARHNQNINALDDSGNYSIHNPKSEQKMLSFAEENTIAELNTNNNGNQELNTNNNGNQELNTNNNGLGCEGGTTMMGELRNLFVNMDGEIQRLRYDLKQRDADDRTYQNLHDELRVLMDKVESGIRANQELETLVSGLEDDKRNLFIKLDECHQTIAERERQIQCMDTRLAERNHQVICLQEENTDKTQVICRLTKEIETHEQKFHQSESGQNQSAEMLLAAEARIKELEEALCHKEVTIQELSDQIVKVNKEYRIMQQKCEKKIDCMNQQIYEFQKQTEQLSADNENVHQKLAFCQKASEECKRLLHNQEDQNQILETQVDELRTTIDEKEKLHCKLLESYQQKICRSNEQIKGLESALLMCRNEVKMHLDTMEKIKNHFNCEIMKRDACIKHLKEELRKCSEDLKCRIQENCSLEQTNAELHNKVTNAYAEIKAAEQNACCLTEKLKNMENIMLKDKACYMKETEELERRLSQALNNLQCSHEEINKLKSMVAEKSAMIDCLQGEKNSLCRDLTKCKDVACSLQDKLTKMERDNQELCRQLQVKMDCIRDMEVTICSKEQELKCCQRCVEELQEKIKRLIEEMNSGGNAVAQLQEKLKACREELLYLTQKLNETDDQLKQCQLNIQDKCEEIRLLNCTINDISCRLHERVARVDELERAIENLNKDVEKRMKRVDEQLRKYECELCDKTKQIADIDDCLSRCQHTLNEKCGEVCVLEQKNTRLCSDLNAANSKLKECSDTRECLGKALSEQRGETAELSQELKATRDQLQQKHQELMDCQQNLCCSNREWDKCRRDVDDFRSSLAQRDCEIEHLNEEKNCLVSKVAHLTCRLENETCQLQNQLGETRCRLEKENESLRVYQTEIEENNACLLQKLGACQRQLSQVEKCCHQKLECMHREIEDLTSRIGDREDQIAQCNECLALRNSEIMRLKLKLCSMESCANRSSNNNSNNDFLDEDSSRTMGRIPSDDIGSPVVLNLHPLQELAITEHPHTSNTGQTTRTQNHPDSKQRWRTREDVELTSHADKRTGDQTMHVPYLTPRQDPVQETTPSPQSSIGLSALQERLQSNQACQQDVEKKLNLLENITEWSPPPINIYKSTTI